jgi:hypothetical protein
VPQILRSPRRPPLQRARLPALPALVLRHLLSAPSARGLPVGRIEIDSCAPAHLKLGRVPASSPLPSRLCLLCRFSQKLHSTSRLAHLCRSRPRGSITRCSLRSPAAAGSLIPLAPLKLVRCPTRSSLPLRLCLDHSHRPVLAPATLAALPSTRAIPDRDVFYVARVPAAPFTRCYPLR